MTEGPITPDLPTINNRFSGDNEKKIVDWAKNAYTNIKGARSSIERQWNLNLAFYFGQQYVLPRGNQGLELYVPPAPYWKTRAVFNHIRKFIRREHAKLTSQKPTAYIIPATSDDRDIFAAQAGEQIWDTMYREKRLKQVFSKAVWWNQICGTAYIKSYWDPDKIVPNATPPDPVTGETALQGDICITYETPYHVFIPDFRSEDIEDQPYIIHAKLKSADWVKLNFPNIAAVPNEEKANEILEAKWLNLIGMQTVKGMNAILVLEVWVKPGEVEILPEGGVFTIIGDEIVQSTEGWPFALLEYPFCKLNHIPSGKFYGESTINDLRPIQKLYNKTRGQIIDSKDSTGKPKILAERGAIRASKITSEPGQVLEYEPAYSKPEFWVPPPIPSYVTQEIDRNLSDMADIAGQHEVSQGQTPPGITAATAINYLQEQDDVLLQETAMQIEAAVEKCAKLTLSYINEFWDAPRLVKITGPDGSFDVQAFKSSNLNGNTDIRIEGGSSLPISKAAKQAFILDMMKLGIIEPEKGLEVMEMGGIQKIYESINQDKRQAQRENLKMAAVTDELQQEYFETQVPKIDPEIIASGDEELIRNSIPIMIPVNSWDNHPAHIHTHNTYRKSQAFEMLPDAAKYLFEQHVMLHEMSMQQDMMQEAAMQQMGGEEMPPDNKESGPPPVAEGF